MQRLTLKDAAPRSLYWRFLLITLLPMIIVQAVGIYMFYERHWSSMSRNMSSALSGEIALIANAYAEGTPRSRPLIQQAAHRYLYLRTHFERGKVLHPTNTLVAEHQLLVNGLGLQIPFPVSVQPDGENYIRVSIGLPDGILSVIASEKRLASSTTYIFIMWLSGTALVMLGIAILFLRNQVRSIVRLTEAAEYFGKGQDLPDFKPQGAREIRLAGIAFIEMRERIRRLLTRRTEMLAGVSHDLRTPLTRMRLQLEMMKQSKDVKELLIDVEEMEEMLDGYLAFARQEGTTAKTELTKTLKLKPYISKIIGHYTRQKSKKLTTDIPTNLSATLRKDAFRRCITNLIENALRYADKVHLSAAQNEDTLQFVIEDNGPGIPRSKREEVFQPFFRLDASRNSETGGVGLGLAIVRDIIHQHGGEIILSDSESLGGLKATITLPQ